MLIPTNNSLQPSNFFQAAFLKFNLTVKIKCLQNKRNKNVASIQLLDKPRRLNNWVQYTITDKNMTCYYAQPTF